MEKISRSAAMNNWAKEMSKTYYPEPTEPPPTSPKIYVENEWLRSVINNIGGVKKLAKLIDRSPGYINNILKGYYPISKELQELITGALKNEK